VTTLTLPVLRLALLNLDWLIPLCSCAVSRLAVLVTEYCREIVVFYWRGMFLVFPSISSLNGISISMRTGFPLFFSLTISSCSLSFLFLVEVSWLVNLSLLLCAVLIDCSGYEILPWNRHFPLAAQCSFYISAEEVFRFWMVTLLMRICFTFFFIRLTISSCSLSFLFLVEVSVWTAPNFSSAALLEWFSSLPCFPFRWFVTPFCFWLRVLFHPGVELPSSFPDVDTVALFAGDLIYSVLVPLFLSLCLVIANPFHHSYIALLLIPTFRSCILKALITLSVCLEYSRFRSNSSYPIRNLVLSFI